MIVAFEDDSERGRQLIQISVHRIRILSDNDLLKLFKDVVQSKAPEFAEGSEGRAPPAASTTAPLTSLTRPFQPDLQAIEAKGYSTAGDESVQTWIQYCACNSRAHGNAAFDTLTLPVAAFLLSLNIIAISFNKVGL